MPFDGSTQPAYSLNFLKLWNNLSLITFLMPTTYIIPGKLVLNSHNKICNIEI